MRSHHALALVLFIFTAGYVVRQGLDIELSVDAIQAWVLALSWKGPILYLALVTFRQFLLLPSIILLPVGGLCFGALMGTALGCAGIVISGVLKFTLGRGLRHAWGGTPSHPNMQRLIARLEAAGPLIVGLGTAHPVGPMTALHWAAGFSSLRLGGFFIAIVLGGLIRAGSFAVLGSTLTAADPLHFYGASAALLGIILLPFAHPNLRRRLIAIRSER